MTVSTEVFNPIQPALMASHPRVLLVHDWLTGMRGGEKVLEVLCHLFPQAPLYTLLHNRGSVSPAIEDRVITTSPLQHMPWSANKYRHYLLLFLAFAEMTKVGVEDADLVISTSHAVAKSMVRRNGGKPRHVCYIHSPMRYVWDRFDDYFGPERVGKFGSQFLFRPIAAGLQQYDRATTDRVDMFVANSRFVADRVQRLYDREAEVLAPPVDIDRFAELDRQPEDWYLVVSALVPYKRVDHAIAACAALGRPLKIVGSGPEEKRLRALATDLGTDVKFLGFVSDDDLGLYYGRARALLFPGVEDFGIVPVEAIATGCPVIALAEGGILDSMTNRTAVLYPDATIDGLMRAIGEFEGRSFNPSELRNHAQKFSIDAFVSGFQDVVARAMQSP
jgi:glycosyltransferase involved in cell wall biosynthesis